MRTVTSDQSAATGLVDLFVNYGWTKAACMYVDTVFSYNLQKAPAPTQEGGPCAHCQSFLFHALVAWGGGLQLRWCRLSDIAVLLQAFYTIAVSRGVDVVLQSMYNSADSTDMERVLNVRALSLAHVEDSLRVGAVGAPLPAL